MADLTAFQIRFLEVLAKRLNGHCSTSEMAQRMKTSRLAIVSAGRALERAGKVTEFRSGRDQWAVMMWAVRRSSTDASGVQAGSSDEAWKGNDAR